MIQLHQKGLTMISLTQSNVRTEITAANEQFMQCFELGDAAGLAALYTPDGQILPPNSYFVYGQAAIQAFWQGVMDSGVRGVRLEIVEVDDHRDTAIEISRYTLLIAGDVVLDEGKYIVIWKQVAWQWKLHRDIFNSSRP